MTDLLATGSAWLEAQRHAHLTQTVAYSRGVDSVALAATIGRTEFEDADEYGVIHRTEARDYLVLAADLVLDGAQVLPVAGDLIKETAGEQTLIYEVMSLGREPPYRYSDPYRQTLRIHTKHIGEE